MAFCKNCGAKLEDGQLFCSSCGAKVGEGDPTSENKTENNNNNNLFKMVDVTSEFDTEDINQNKVFAIFAYIYFLVFIPMFAAKGSKFARFNANQGLVLLIAIGISSILYWIPFVGWILATPIFIACTILMVFGIVNSAMGKAKELPIISKIKILK